MFTTRQRYRCLRHRADAEVASKDPKRGLRWSATTPARENADVDMGKFPSYTKGMNTKHAIDPSIESPEQLIDAHVVAAAARLFHPLAQLFVSHGLKFGQAEELLKEAFVYAGSCELQAAGTVANQSRLSVSTGVHRKDVRRLMQAQGSAHARRAFRSVATEIYTRWSTSPLYHDGTDALELPIRDEKGGASFERLAREISTDIHPRSALEELRRLGLVVLLDDGARVRLTPGGFVPLLARSELLDLLAGSTGDHLSTAVANVLGREARQLEQSVFDGGFSADDARAIDAAARRIWARAMRELVALMEALVQQNGRADADASHRVRVGMYCHWEPEQGETH
ncbi:MAG: DUF6502 family protein [Burkholderiaceae bacterium]